MCEIVLVSHVALVAEIVIMTLRTVPANADDARATTHVTRHKHMSCSCDNNTEFSIKFVMLHRCRSIMLSIQETCERYFYLLMSVNNQRLKKR